MAANRLRATILLAGVLLSAVGCMVPMYRQPGGYSGSYARYLNGGADHSDSSAFADVSTQRSENRAPQLPASPRPGTPQTPAGEQPPQPPRL